MTRTAAHTHWMVRKNDMRIFRPIPQHELIQKIANGEIAPNDELCAGNGYWFLLSEVNEVRAHLGDIDLSCLHSKDMGEHTSSTDTRPIQKTALIAEKLVLEASVQNVAAAPIAGVRREFKTTGDFKVEAFTQPEIQPQVTIEEDPKRMKNALGVVIVFIVFVIILALFWSGSY